MIYSYQYLPYKYDNIQDIQQLLNQILSREQDSVIPEYYIQAIVRLLRLIFKREEDVAIFCYDYFPTVYATISPKMSLDIQRQQLFDYCHDNQKFAKLLPLVRDMDPDQYLEYEPLFRKVAHTRGTQPPRRFFICYKSYTQPDHQLANYLFAFFKKLGHEVAIDPSWAHGQAHPVELSQSLESSDFLLVLLSEQSVDSEMMRAEIKKANQYYQRQGKPESLLVRINYEGLLPYSIETFLEPKATFIWQNETDHERIGYEILSLVEGNDLPTKAIPVQPKPQTAKPEAPRPKRTITDEIIVSEDGRRVHNEQTLFPPMPEFDPRFLEIRAILVDKDELFAPGGAVKLQDRLYVERQGDQQLTFQLQRKMGTTTTIRAPRQMGKSSLLVRGVHQALQKGAKVAYVDLQGTDYDYLKSLNNFLHHLATLIFRKLHLDVADVEKFWRPSLGAKDNLTYLLEDYVLSPHTPIVLALDEVDLLLQNGQNFHTEFFALLRSWHNNRASDFEGKGWDKFYIVMAISTEPYLLIQDVHQSPFNVGETITLTDFDPTQTFALNWKHGKAVKSTELGEFMELLSGHPYLTRKALYTMVTQELSWPDFLKIVDTDLSPFGDHLRHHWLLVNDKPGLPDALREVISAERCSNEIAAIRLVKAGLIKKVGKQYLCRCGLYRNYFKEKLWS